MLVKKHVGYVYNTTCTSWKIFKIQLWFLYSFLIISDWFFFGIHHFTCTKHRCSMMQFRTTCKKPGAPGEVVWMAVWVGFWNTLPPMIVGKKRLYSSDVCGLTCSSNSTWSVTFTMWCHGNHCLSRKAWYVMSVSWCFQKRSFKMDVHSIFRGKHLSDPIETFFNWTFEVNFWGLVIWVPIWVALQKRGKNPKMDDL